MEDSDYDYDEYFAKTLIDDTEIEKEKPKFFFTRTKKDTTKTPVKPIVVPVVTPTSDSL